MTPKKYKDIVWRNPYSKRFCFVAAEGLTVARVEDLVQTGEHKNTRLLQYAALDLELVFCDEKMQLNTKRTSRQRIARAVAPDGTRMSHRA